MHTTKMTFAWFLTYFCFVSVAFAQSAENFVFRIRDKDINRKGSMTGFLYRYQQYTGVVTCLHGIVPGRQYTAEGEVDGKPNLTLKFVDIDHDAAFLTADYLKNQNVGIRPAGVNLVPGQHLKVLGYPAGMAGLNDHSAIAGRHPVKRLKDMLPSDITDLFDARQSPSPNINVLYIEGSMVPGHSGAPLLDNDNRLYGFVDGGVFQGAAQITWGIPIDSIKWIDVNKPGLIEKINHLPISVGQNNLLFDFAFDNDTKKSDTLKLADLNGLWKLTMENAPSIKGDNTPLGGHWEVGGQVTLTFRDDNSVIGRFGSRSDIYCKEAVVTGTLNNGHLELKFICSNGSCSGTGYTISANLLGKKFVGKDDLLPDRPTACILHLSNQVTLEKQ